MKETQFCRELRLWLKREIKVLQRPEGDAKAILYHDLYLSVYELSAGVNRFLLPVNGHLMRDISFKALDADDPLNLPYGIIALEWRRDTSEDVKKGLMPNGDIYCPKGILFAIEPSVIRARWKLGRPLADDDVVLVSVPYLADRHRWLIYPPVFLPKNNYIRRTHDGQRVELNIKHDPRYPRIPPEDIMPEMSVFLSFMNVLACSNVGVSNHSSRRRSKSTKPAFQYDDYHLLSVGGDHAHGSAPDSGHPGGHRSPREHLRRGHIRRYESGKKIWVNSTVVNPGIGGRSEKSYLVEG